jgi:hypothetical protein
MRAVLLFWDRRNATSASQGGCRKIPSPEASMNASRAKGQSAYSRDTARNPIQVKVAAQEFLGAALRHGHGDAAPA